MPFLFITALDHAFKNALNIHEDGIVIEVTQRQRRQRSAATLTISGFNGNIAFISNKLKKQNLYHQE